MANRKGRTDSKNVYVSTTKDGNEIKALASKLKEQYDYLVSKLDSDTNNKNCEKYSQKSLKCSNNTVAVSQKKLQGNHSVEKYNGKTATRKERRKKSSKKKVSSQNTKRERYIKNLLNRTLTDSQRTREVLE